MAGFSFVRASTSDDCGGQEVEVEVEVEVERRFDSHLLNLSLNLNLPPTLEDFFSIRPKGEICQR